MTIIELRNKRAKALEAAKDNGRMYAEAIAAMRTYSGYSEVDDDEFENY